MYADLAYINKWSVRDLDEMDWIDLVFFYRAAVKWMKAMHGSDDKG